MGRREQFSTGELTLVGISQKIGTVTLTVLQRDGAGKVLLASGTTVPTDGVAGYAKGCIFIDTDVTTGSTGLYENVGTTASCNFDALGVPTVGELALTTGSVLVGAANLASALDAKGNGKILVGNGTTVTSVSVSGDATLANTGALTIANDAITTAKILDGNVTAAKWSAGAGVAAVLSAGLGGSDAIIKSETGTHTLVAAHATKDRACIVVATVTEAFATGDTSRTIITVGEADTPDKLWAATTFPNGLALGTVLVGAFTNTATKAITATSTAAAGTGTGGVALTVLAIPTT